MPNHILQKGQYFQQQFIYIRLSAGVSKHPVGGGGIATLKCCRERTKEAQVVILSQITSLATIRCWIIVHWTASNASPGKCYELPTFCPALHSFVLIAIWDVWSLLSIWGFTYFKFEMLFRILNCHLIIRQVTSSNCN